MRNTILLALGIAALGASARADEVRMDRSGNDTVSSPFTILWEKAGTMVVHAYRDSRLVFEKTLPSASVLDFTDGPVEIKIWEPGASAPHRSRSILIHSPTCTDVNLERLAAGDTATVCSDQVAVRWDDAHRKMMVQLYRDGILMDTASAYSGIRFTLKPGISEVKLWVPGDPAPYAEGWIRRTADEKPVVGGTEKGFGRYDISLDLSRESCCPLFRPLLTDIVATETTVDGSPRLDLKVNAEARPGVYAGAIVHEDRTPPEAGSLHTLSGRVRMVPGSQVQHVDVNVSLVEDSVERFAEVFIGLNKEDPAHYKQVWTRNSEREYIPLFKVAEDTGYHRFRITVEYGPAPEKARKIRCIGMDGRDTVLDLEMGRRKKSWPSHFKVLLEAQNMYPNCDSAITTVAETQWDSIGFVKEQGMPCPLLPVRARAMGPLSREESEGLRAGPWFGRQGRRFDVLGKRQDMAPPAIPGQAPTIP